jgi:integrase
MRQEAAMTASLGSDNEVLPVIGADAGRAIAAYVEAEGEARSYIGRAKSSATLRAYRADWKAFVVWCKDHGRQALPADPETLAVFIAAQAQCLKVATIQRRLASISQAHQAAGLGSPTGDLVVRATMAGIRRTLGVAPQQKAPVLVDDLRTMVDALPSGLLGVRDRALLTIGFAGAFRRSELVALDVDDIEDRAEGLVVTLRRSKTDQEGAGREVGIPYGALLDTCPVRALRAWLEASCITDGPIFRPVNRHGQIAPERLSDRAVARVVQRTAEAAGLDPARYAGHSLRAGLATSAAAAGKSERAIMAQTGHRSVGMVRRYIRSGSLWQENAAAGIGL